MFANFDKKKLKLNFARSAQNYDKAAPIQRLVASKLCKIAAPFIQEKLNVMLSLSRHDSGHGPESCLDKLSMTLRVLDLGSGTGFIATNLDKNLEIFESDLAFEMLQQNRSRNSLKIQADFENLPFKNNSFDILISSFSLQWLTDFDKNFAQFFALLKPKGILIFCLPTDGSLSELKAADIFNFNPLPKIADLETSLKKAGFSKISFEKEIVKQSFENGVEALKSLKRIGANYSEKNNKIITKTILAQFNNFCLKNFGTSTRKIETSWAVSYFILSK